MVITKCQVKVVSHNYSHFFFCSITDSKYSSRRSRLKIDMISCPQGDVKHMGHVGLDGAYFGDIEFMSTNAPKVINNKHIIVNI